MSDEEPRSTPVWVACDRSLLTLHVAAQLAFLLAVTVHVGLVLGHQIARRNGLLRRLL